MLGRAGVQESSGKFFAVLGDIHVLLGEVLNLVGVDSGLSGIFKTFLQGIIFVNILGVFKHDTFVDRTCSCFE